MNFEESDAIVGRAAIAILAAHATRAGDFLRLRQSLDGARAPEEDHPRTQTHHIPQTGNAANYLSQRTPETHTRLARGYESLFLWW